MTWYIKLTSFLRVTETSKTEWNYKWCRTPIGLEWGAQMTFLMSLIDKKLVSGIQIGTGNQVFGPFKTGLSSKIGDLIGNRRIPSGGQMTGTNTYQETPGISLK